MPIEEALRITLIGATETGSLVFLCGAGLSMAPPSSLPSAKLVAQKWYDAWAPVEVLDPAIRDDIDKIADVFYTRGQFRSVFIQKVAWNELTGTPNDGHAAISDLLLTRGAHAALSANFDPMIERWATDRKIFLQGALTGNEAVSFQITSNPLLKFHGCMVRSMSQTLWTQKQLAEPDVASRVDSCTQWMNLNLPGKHLVVVGFWTDWGYLNEVLADAFEIENASSVTVIDPSSAAELMAKAPDLWTKLNALSAVFEHIQTSGAEFLAELRTEYSKTWVRKFYALGVPLAHASGTGVPAAATPDGLSMDSLYDLRRDVEGMPYFRAATLNAPPVDASQTAFFHFKLLNAGAVRQGAWLELGGQLIRVVNGAGLGLEDVRNRYKEPASITHSDIVVCVGAIDLGVPATVVPTGRGASVLRPSAGAGSLWLTYDQAQIRLGL